MIVTYINEITNTRNPMVYSIINVNFFVESVLHCVYGSLLNADHIKYEMNRLAAPEVNNEAFSANLSIVNIVIEIIIIIVIMIFVRFYEHPSPPNQVNEEMSIYRVEPYRMNVVMIIEYFQQDSPMDYEES